MPSTSTATSTPSPLVKDIVVARVGRNFVNGKQEFDLTAQNIDEIIANFTVLKKQVPLLLTPEHIFGARKSAIPAAGWVEAMYRAGDDWHARVKLVGDAATLVANDQFRGVSIGTVMARDVHGKPVGEALDHLLITNAPFFNDLNIAAVAAAGISASAAAVDHGDGVVRYLTAEPAEAFSREQMEFIRYAAAIAADDGAAAAEATRQAAAPSPGVLKQTVPDSFAGHGENRPDESGLLADPAYKKARAAGDSAGMARIAHEFGRKK